MSNQGKISSKILSMDNFKSAVDEARTQQKKIVFTNGCFDILHLGHIDYLSKAADLGDVLIIGLNTDESVKKLKGNNRPINDQIARASMLASLFFVDLIIPFSESTPYKLIKTIVPDILVKGGDYKEEEVVGNDIVKASQGIIKIIDFLDGYSTTGISKKLRDNI